MSYDMTTPISGTVCGS